MIRLFGIKDTSFATNGDKVILPVKAKVRKEDNGAFYLELETDLSYADDLTSGRIVCAATPQGDQAFRIGNVKRTRKKIALKANHLFYDSANYLIKDSYAVDMNCNAALDHFNTAATPESPFVTISDIPIQNSMRIVRKSLCEAVSAVVGRWGGHLVRDNWTIGVRAVIGADNGVTVRYAKNLQDITCQETWDNVVTRLLPVGKDGILLPEEYVDAPVQYEIPYCKTVSFRQSVSEEDYQNAEGQLDTEAYAEALIRDLRQQAEAYVTENCVPKVSYSLKAHLEKVTDIGDVVRVADERLGLDLTTNVIAYTYDCILGKYTELVFGNFTDTLSGLIPSINEQTAKAVEESEQTVRVTLGKELQAATDKIWGVLGNSYVQYDGDKILVLDSLPAESATNVLMISNGGIGFSQTGIHGVFNSAWTIDGTLNMQNINVINLVADMIKGGTLKLGSRLNQSGILELYDEANTLIGRMDKTGLKMFGQDGSYVMMNNDVGFSGYDRNDTRIYWVDGMEFHMKKSVVEEEITLCSKMRFIPITMYDQGVAQNDGIGLVTAR